MLLYEVNRTDGTSCVVTILKDKETGKYHFVNLTKEHICPCEFDEVEYAIFDLENYKKRGIVESYKMIGDIHMKQ